MGVEYKLEKNLHYYVLRCIFATYFLKENNYKN